jgi:hypothetical protein
MQVSLFEIAMAIFPAGRVAWLWRYFLYFGGRVRKLAADVTPLPATFSYCQLVGNFSEELGAARLKGNGDAVLCITLAENIFLVLL